MTTAFEDELQDSLQPEPTVSLIGQSAIVTGASSGIGLATALRLLREGVDVVAVARRLERLADIQAFVTAHPAVFKGTLTTLSADVRDGSFLQALATLPTPNILIANAGLARGRTTVAQSQSADIDEMITTNISAVFSLIHKLLPRMIEKGGGSIIGLGSVAGHAPYENGAVYCATKHALRAFFEALRQETCHLPLRIALVSPGLVETEFSLVRYQGNTSQAQSVYEGLTCLKGRDIADIITYILTRPRHVNLDNVLVMPQAQASVFKIARNQETR